MIGIIDYGLGNVRSVAGAVRRLGFDPVITADIDRLFDAEKLILPGVGAFGDGMRQLAARRLIDPLSRMVMEDGKPILGICLGAQLLTRDSDEFGHHEGLGWIDAEVRRLSPDDPALRIPHVGWNEMAQDRPCLLFDEVPSDALFYYVHSHGIRARDPAVVAGTCDYGGRFVAALSAGAVYGTQFHPEKSQRHGLTVLGNFLRRG